MQRSSEEVCDFFATLVKDHAGIEARLKELDQAALALSRAAGDAAALEVVSRTLAFFETDGARHEADEELSLLPRLRPLPEFRQILTAMDFQHKMNDAAEQELAACVAKFAPERGRELLRLVLRFVEMHRGHMFAEERAVFPTAASGLSRDDLAEMGREMQDRRRAAPRA
jgi:hemerythrin-like domain-containing protein